jgi:hypothetical protein
VERRAPSRDWSRASMHGHRGKPAMQRPSDLRIEIESLRRLSRTELRARWAPSSVIPTGGDPPPRGERSSGNDSKSCLHPDKGVTVRLRRPSAALATATARCCWSAEHPVDDREIRRLSALKDAAGIDADLTISIRNVGTRSSSARQPREIRATKLMQELHGAPPGWQAGRAVKKKTDRGRRRGHRAADAQKLRRPHRSHGSYWR